MDPLGSTKNANGRERRLWFKEQWDTTGGKSLTHSGRTSCSGFCAVYLSGYVFTIPSRPFCSDGRALCFSFQTSVLPFLLVSSQHSHYYLKGGPACRNQKGKCQLSSPCLFGSFPLGYLLENWTTKATPSRDIYLVDPPLLQVEETVEWVSRRMNLKIFPYQKFAFSVDPI